MKKKELDKLRKKAKEQYHIDEEIRKEYVRYFWSEEYPGKTFEEKVHFWSGSIHRQMRWNGESGLDEMAVFSKSDYEDWKKKEPLIDEILAYVIKRLNLNAERVSEELKK